MSSLARTNLGPYQILALLGAGGMGEVYRARDPRLGREVAVKVLPTSFSADAKRLHRFEQEARGPECSIIRTFWPSTTWAPMKALRTSSRSFWKEKLCERG
jgi:serine/threonine protein kinase